MSLEQWKTVSDKFNITENDTLETANEKASNVLKEYHYMEDVNLQWDKKQSLKVTGTLKIEVTDISLGGKKCKMKIYWNGDDSKTYELEQDLTQSSDYATTLSNAIWTECKISINKERLAEVAQNLTTIAAKSEKDRKALLPYTKQLSIDVNIPAIITKDKEVLEDHSSLSVGSEYVGTKERPDWYTAKLQGNAGAQLDDPVSNPDDYDPGAITGYQKVFDIADVIISIIKWVGATISVIILMILGFKFLTGSIEEKAEYKKTMIPYIVGCILLFAGSFVLQLIYDLVTVSI